MAWVLTWFVQSAALAAATTVMVQLPGFRTRASARAAAWTVALCAMAALPGWMLLPSMPAEAIVVPTAADGALTTVATPAWVLPAVPAAWRLTGLLVWAAGAVVWLAWGVREVRRVRQLKRASEPWSADDASRIAPWASAHLAARGASLRWCDGLDGPALLGFRHPAIALPRVHGERLSDEELQHVLLHEAAHLRRRDDWASLAEWIVTGALWINPAVHVARRSLGIAREMACDEWVVRRTAAPVAYARCLTTVADLRRAHRQSSLATAATGRTSVLTRRVTRVLDANRRSGARAAHAMSLLTPVAVGFLAVALLQLPAFVIDGSGPAAAPSTVAMRGESAPRVDSTPAAAEPFLPVRPVGTPTPRQAEAAGPAETSPATALPQNPGAPPASTGAALDAAVEPTAPLPASPVPGAGAPGLHAAPAQATMGQTNQPDQPSVWGRAAQFGSATGEGAAAAGRATSSFFKRLGTSVSQSLTR